MPPGLGWRPSSVPVRASCAHIGRCVDFCALEWLSLRGEYSGTLYNESQVLVRVPYGLAEEPDRRRAGVWYVGVKALPDESVEFELTASLFQVVVTAITAVTTVTRLPHRFAPFRFHSSRSRPPRSPGRPPRVTASQRRAPPTLHAPICAKTSAWCRRARLRGRRRPRPRDTSRRRGCWAIRSPALRLGRSQRSWAFSHASSPAEQPTACTASAYCTRIGGTG